MSLCRAFYCFFIFNNTKARMLDSIFHIKIKKITESRSIYLSHHNRTIFISRFGRENVKVLTYTKL